jgi:PIN domain nuclease of toxin-antitoxin system
MRLLLDTQAFLWFILQDSRLSWAAEAAISLPANEVLVSPASYWEIAIKVSIGKLALSQPFDPFIEQQIVKNQLVVLPIEPRHAARVVALPFHHRDPFDRILVAQSLLEGIPLVSSDARLDQYGIRRIW